jgi:hypothetical protein
MADFKTTCRGPNCGREITMGTLPDGRPHPYDVWRPADWDEIEATLGVLR